MPALRIKLPHSEEVTHILRGQRITVGRGADNTIQILDRSVSSHHAEIFAVNGHFQLHDLESTNLTQVEGEPITDFHLRGPCRISFGLVECEYDPTPSPPAPEATPPSAAMAPEVPKAVEESPSLSVAELENDTAFLRAENADLRGKITFLQNRLDMLGSARLVTRTTDSSPGTVSSEALKALKTERDELKHRTAALELELGNARMQLEAALGERDAAVRLADRLQTEKVAALQALSAAANAAPMPGHGPAGEGSEPAVQRGAPTVPRGLERVLPAFRQLGAALEGMLAVGALAARRQEASEAALRLIEQCAEMEGHAFTRIARGAGDLLRMLAESSEPPLPPTLRTLRQAGELLAKLLEPRALEEGKNLPQPQVLIVDDDAGLLASVEATLHLTEMATTSCLTAEDAWTAIHARNFDLIVVDVGLPGMDGMTFCAQARELPGYRKTPILFLTGEDTLDKRAETSLSGGTDFMSKPFNVFELALKVQVWASRRQLGLR